MVYADDFRTDKELAVKLASTHAAWVQRIAESFECLGPANSYSKPDGVFKTHRTWPAPTDSVTNLDANTKAPVKATQPLDVSRPQRIQDALCARESRLATEKSQYQDLMEQQARLRSGEESLHTQLAELELQVTAPGSGSPSSSKLPFKGTTPDDEVDAYSAEELGNLQARITALEARPICTCCNCCTPPATP